MKCNENDEFLERLIIGHENRLVYDDINRKNRRKSKMIQRKQCWKLISSKEFRRVIKNFGPILVQFLLYIFKLKSNNGMNMPCAYPFQCAKVMQQRTSIDTPIAD